LLIAGGVGFLPGRGLGEWQTFGPADGLAGGQVRSITEDHSGNLWFGTWTGLSCYDGVNWRTYTVADGLADDHVVAIVEDRLGSLWVGSIGGGVSRYDGAS